MNADLSAAYSGKRVLVTGDLGFKGSHLVKALEKLGAEVSGFDIKREGWGTQDIRLYHTIRGALRDVQPDFVFHLAAQAFVPRGYRDPRATFETNALGTVNLLDALWASRRPCAVVVVTTDKVYGESGDPLTHYAFREIDPLVPRCPYSASKIAAEHAVAAYRDAYFWPAGNKIAVATARAGNVIGGGDWGEERLVPNAIRALREGRPVPVYNPDAVRPWQAVEDVVDGYLLLGAALAGASQCRGPSPFYSAFNFGPAEHHTVKEVVDQVIAAWGSGVWNRIPHELRETAELRIDSTKARRLLDWKSRWGFVEMIQETVKWYKDAAL